jgi:hypothetical protein
VLETRVPNWETVPNSVCYQSDPFHLPSHPIEWCSWTMARLEVTLTVPCIWYPLEYSLGEVLKRYIRALADSFVLIGVPRWILRSRYQGAISSDLRNTNKGQLGCTKNLVGQLYLKIDLIHHVSTFIFYFNLNTSCNRMMCTRHYTKH